MGGEGGISHPKLCAGAGERSGGPGEDSLQYFSLFFYVLISHPTDSNRLLRPYAQSDVEKAIVFYSC